MRIKETIGGGSAGKGEGGVSAYWGTDSKINFPPSLLSRREKKRSMAGIERVLGDDSTCY